MHNYKVEVYQYGSVVFEMSSNDIDEIKRFYYKYDSYDFGPKLYVDGKPLKVHEAIKLLGSNENYLDTLNRYVGDSYGKYIRQFRSNKKDNAR